MKKKILFFSYFCFSHTKHRNPTKQNWNWMQLVGSAFLPYKSVSMLNMLKHKFSVGAKTVFNTNRTEPITPLVLWPLSLSDFPYETKIGGGGQWLWSDGWLGPVVGCGVGWFVVEVGCGVCLLFWCLVFGWLGPIEIFWCFGDCWVLASIWRLLCVFCMFGC